MNSKAKLVFGCVLTKDEMMTACLHHLGSTSIETDYDRWIRLVTLFNQRFGPDLVLDYYCPYYDACFTDCDFFLTFTSIPKTRGELAHWFSTLDLDREWKPALEYLHLPISIEPLLLCTLDIQ
jgi:hypothetical protein